MDEAERFARTEFLPRLFGMLRQPKGDNLNQKPPKQDAAKSDENWKVIAEKVNEPDKKGREIEENVKLDCVRCIGEIATVLRDEVTNEEILPQLLALDLSDSTIYSGITCMLFEQCFENNIFEKC